MHKIIQYLAQNPKRLFFMDSIGALTSALLMLVISTNFNPYFGIPMAPVKYLVAIAACLFLYSVSCFIFLKRNWPPFIIGIAIANLFYCLFTSGIIVYHYAELTLLGITYFLLEIGLIAGIAFMELLVASSMKTSSKNDA